MYVVINGEHLPTEVFAFLGKNGACARCQTEALTRAISLGLRYGIPITAYIQQLKGIQCPNPSTWPEEERTLSCPDAVARALEEWNDKNGDNSH